MESCSSGHGEALRRTPTVSPGGLQKARDIGTIHQAGGGTSDGGRHCAKRATAVLDVMESMSSLEPPRVSLQLHTASIA